ncbi:MAG: hypothetical protein LBT52_07085 [Clostridiales Family XIII bacterium]|jgi:hypothetical protein|nr:hypothetical protein [Clostridiales Family XIII bacterium]
MARYGILKRNIRQNIKSWDKAEPTPPHTARATTSKIIAVFLALSLAGSFVPLVANVIFRIPDLYQFDLGRTQLIAQIGERTGVTIADEKSDESAGEESDEDADASEKSSESAGEESDEDADAGEKSSESAGEELDESAGEESGESAGVKSGESTGEESGESAGEESGESAGEESGESTGEKSDADADENADEKVEEKAEGKVANAISSYMRHKTDSFQIEGVADGHSVQFFTANDSAVMKTLRSFLDNILVIGLTSLALFVALYIILVRWQRPRELKRGFIGGIILYGVIIGVTTLGIVVKGPLMKIWVDVIGAGFTPADRMPQIFQSGFFLSAWAAVTFITFVILLLLFSLTHRMTRDEKMFGEA